MNTKKMYFATFAILSPLLTNAQASCWDDSRLVELRDKLITERFKPLSTDSPQILSCNDTIFPSGVGGTYGGGVIRIPASRVNTAHVEAAVAHELAHAAVERSGCSDPWSSQTAGHGACFYAELRRAGFAFEAERVARHYAPQGGLDALAQASPRTQGRAPIAPGDQDNSRAWASVSPRLCTTDHYVGQRCGRRGCFDVFSRSIAPC